MKKYYAFAAVAAALFIGGFFWYGCWIILGLALGISCLYQVLWIIEHPNEASKMSVGITKPYR